MINAAMLTIFIPTFLFVSATPGMCMTLSMTLGMTIGLRRTLWMMVGELIGVGIVVVCSMAGVAAILLKYPSVFTSLKLIGGTYLAFLGLQLWSSRGRMAVQENTENQSTYTRSSLATQGFVTAIANPKGWAFFIALLPPFIDQTLPLLPQLSTLLILILSIELICLIAYASGGQSLAHLLKNRNNVRILNKIAGTLMLAVGAWLAFG